MVKFAIKGQEHAKGSSKGDLKSFHIGNPAISNPKNIWPIEVDQFEEIGTNLFDFGKYWSYNFRGYCIIFKS